jgi:hypothetical protein
MVGLLIPIYVISAYMIDGHRDYSNLSLQQFIVGRWKLQGNQPRNVIEPFEFEFVPPATLIWNFDSPNGIYNNIVYHYEFVADNKIQITGRGGDEWEIEKQGNLLVVHSAHEPISTNVYKRLPVLNWLVIVLILGVLIVVSVLVALRRLNTNRQLEKGRGFNNPEYLDLYQDVVNNLIALPMFGLGVFIGIVIWNLPALLLIKLPWDAIITFESALIILIFGIVTIIINRFRSKASAFSSKGIWYHLGVFLIGCSIWGNIAGLFRFIFFVTFGNYPH